MPLAGSCKLVGGKWPGQNAYLAGFLPLATVTAGYRERYIKSSAAGILVAHIWIVREVYGHCRAPIAKVPCPAYDVAGDGTGKIGKADGFALAVAQGGVKMCHRKRAYSKRLLHKARAA